MFRTVGVIVIITIVGLATALPADPVADHSKPVFLERPDLGFSLNSRQPLLEERHWDHVDNPRKFVHQIVLRAGSSQLFVQYWPLEQRSSEWWMEAVMGFLFQPETTVYTDITSNGYDATTIFIPGGPQAQPETNVLVITPRAAFRFICPDCEARKGSADLAFAVDSLLSLEDAL
jgi:hypothetical protein